MTATAQSPPDSGGATALLAPLMNAIGAQVDASVDRSAALERDPALIAQIVPFLNLLNDYFATEYRGWEHVPRNAPCLIVGNHSGGAVSTDFWFLLHRWVEDRGAEAPLYSLAYDLLFATPLANTLRRLGIIPASHANARRALAMRVPVAVFPGGDREAFRSWRERNRIDFAGRTGFVRLAIASRVPVVPMTIHGAHQSTFVLTRGDGFAHATGLDRLHVSVFPFIWSIPFGPVPAIVPTIPLPAKVTVHFGAPLDWTHYRRSQCRDPRVLRACYDEITARMQKTMDRLGHENLHPVLSRLNQLGSRSTPSPRQLGKAPHGRGRV